MCVDKIEFLLKSVVNRYNKFFATELKYIFFNVRLLKSSNDRSKVALTGYFTNTFRSSRRSRASTSMRPIDIISSSPKLLHHDHLSDSFCSIRLQCLIKCLIKRFSIPLLNRLSKHFFISSTMLNRFVKA